MSKRLKSRLLGLVTGFLLLAALPAVAAGKNIFLMISDGASFGTWDMADLYQYGKTTSSPYFGPEFRKYLMTTYPLNMSTTPKGGNTQEVSYDPASAWNTATKSGGANNYPYYFEGYYYLRQNAVDSAAAGTALATGVKTYNNAINWGNDPAGSGAPITPTIAELAKQSGYKVGTISSVQWSHATPASFSNAHNISRNNYEQIAKQMLSGNTMDLIMGAGHPWYDNDGKLRTTPDYKYVGGEATWNSLKNGTHSGGWKLIETRNDFKALANNQLNPLPSRLVGTAQVATTLQQSRSGYGPADEPYEDPLNSNVPSLLTMTQGAVNFLHARSQNDGAKGFFLQIEGGAVDWAAHSNQTARIIEEQLDFNRAVQWVIQWIEANGGWDNNLLIITTDHGNGLPMGPKSDTIPFQRISYNDIIGIPRVKWHTNNHTNELVPLFVRGYGANLFDSLVDGTDTYFATYFSDWAQKGFDGRYIDNTDVFRVMNTVVTPIPATVWLLAGGLAGLAVLGRRQRRWS